MIYNLNNTYTYNQMKPIKSKTVFKFEIDHGLDIITNSSSELFVLTAKTKELVTEMIESAYPNYLTEYEPPVLLRDCENDSFSTYLSYSSLDNWQGYTREEAIKSTPEGIHWEELYEIDSFKLRNRKEEKYILKYDLSDDTLNKLKTFLDPENKTYLLFSIDENPDGDMQDKLSEIGIRYHLG